MTEENQTLTKKERRELKRQQETEWRQHKEKSNFVKRIALWTLVAVGIGGIVFGIVKSGDNSSDGSNQPASLADVISQSDWFKGNKESKIVLVEYSDFQCPACGYYYPMVKKLNEELGDKIGFAYRHFPLPQHKNAKIAAYAAEAAGKQGKFWEMHDMIFDNQKKWSEEKGAKDIFIDYAKALNLNLDQFRGDLDSKAIQEKVESDYQSGVRSKVDSTPSFFLNGEKIQNPQSYDDFKSLVEKSSAGQ